MSDDNCDVIFKGVLEGGDPKEAEQAFARLFKLAPEKAARLFKAGKEVALRKSVSRELAENYCRRLREIGVNAEPVTAFSTQQQAEAARQPAAGSQQDMQEAGADRQTGASAMALEPAEPTAPPASPPEEPAGDQTGEDAGERVLPFVFTGEGSEYFRIWIVNLFLTIVTLGIYSAWAKVRKKRYFYGNTWLDDSSFEYTADPKKILIGRVIAVVMLVIYTSAESFSVTLSGLLFLLFMVFLPWIIVKALGFNARYSNYRNVTFNFRGNMLDAAMAFLLWPLAAMLTLGILAPYAIYQQQKFVLGHHAYGKAGFEFNAEPLDYYKVFFVLFAIVMLAAVVAIAVSAAGLPQLGVVMFMAIYLLAFAGFTVMIANLRYNSTTLLKHGFHAAWEIPSYAKLLLVNTVLIGLTLGLFIPWAQVRTARYKAEHTWFIANGDVESFIADEQQQVDAVGEGVSDIFDIEIGL